MKRIFSSPLAAVILLWTLICCGPIESPQSLQDQISLQEFSRQAGYHLLTPTEKYLLPEALIEISGLSYYRKNVLACVQDELGTIFLYSLKDKSISERLKFARNGDFEGLAVVNKSIFVAKSNGNLYQYLESSDSTIKIETPLSTLNDVEGLAFDAEHERLLIACKESAALKGKDVAGKAVYSYYLSGDFNPTPAYIIKKQQIDEWNDRQNVPIEISKKMKRFKPSGLAVHPKNKDIYIIAYSGRVLIVYNPKGNIRHFIPLPAKIFKQPEGICFAPNGDLFIANEGHGGQANILKFDWNKKE